jgi:hypothetical protein
VRTYLLTQVGEGALRRSDILFSIPGEQRRTFESFIKANAHRGHWGTINAAQTAGHERETFRLYLDLATERVWRGDLYEYIADIELLMHDLVRSTLTGQYGDSEKGWWRQGVPIAVRTACVTARENDPTPVPDPFSYTTFIHLADIVEKNWEAFRGALPTALDTSKKDFLSSLRRLNSIRNGVMHPSKRIEMQDDDFLFVRTLWQAYVPDRRIPPVS